MQEITEDTAKRMLQGITIPPQPQIMVDLQMEMANPNATLDDIADIIAKDIGISGSVLKVVNSPAFSRLSKITSIKQALGLLGMQNVVNIVNCLSLRNSFSQDELLEMTKVWDSAMDIAAACAAIAKRLGICSADEAYTLGLFHDSGITLLMGKFQGYPNNLLKADRYAHQRITDVENSTIKTNHAVVGYYVAKAWQLPVYLSLAISGHHKADDIFADKIQCDSQKKNLLATLKLAEYCCAANHIFGRECVINEFERLKSHLLIYLGLSEYDLEDLLAEIHDLGIGG